ncbi:hypothetical protein K491DRAFT_592800 [Lophiostoma macrostomum CBS 122681]|uniref:Oxidase ustYa n=1 Tax=Lophiostoma macrostomum CBS 122681 TaxID=1314788 RepID=A0A6A6TEV1_9PLEO|nr:hypothetical protein K491DRAFT_592800 [Lophiostoma macrostomum CBS 122681]
MDVACPKYGLLVLCSFHLLIRLSVGQGTVEYPRGSHRFFTISTAHQLHCLWTIERLFYDVSPHNNQEPSDMSHMRHCFDYIRQSLMCAADSTLEPVDPVLGGVTGWNVTRRCRSYTDLKKWAEKHRASNAHGFM